MQRIDIVRRSPIPKSPRLAILFGMTDYPATATETVFTASVTVDLPDEWNIGLIVGPSGSGKTTILRELFGEPTVPQWDDRPIFDCFSLSPSETMKVLAGVGLNSVPAWLRPRHLLSVGEGFRADMARLIAEHPLAIVDEFTSTVDRQVAIIACHAVQRYVRTAKRRLVVASCHYDVLDWLQPDWVIDMADGSFTRRSLQRRPPLELEIGQVSAHKAWRIFEPHHYMKGPQSAAIKAWCAFLAGKPVAYCSYRILPLATSRNIMLASRLVVLPDYQGLGIGRALGNYVAATLKARGYRVRLRTAHPAAQHILETDPCWRFITADRGRTIPIFSIKQSKWQQQRYVRVTRCYEYVGEARV